VKLLAIDPGNTESALLLYDTEQKIPEEWAKLPNDEALNWMFEMRLGGVDHMAVEMIASYGMAVGASVFETCVWIGRFIQAWQAPNAGLTHELVYRREVKMHLCGSMRAKDANIRQALIDRYGGKELAIGKKATPGHLYGLSGDCWSALGVAVTVAERPPVEEQPEQLALA
jgi:hypothetical protein